MIPTLRNTELGDVVDSLDVQMVPGQSVTDWEKQATALGHAFRAFGVRVRDLKPGWVRLEVIHGDLLAQPVGLPWPSPEPVDLEAVPVGVTERGGTWREPVLYSHTIEAGMTGSGKSGKVWATLAGLGPAIRDGVVTVNWLDPKGGMEAAAAEPLCDRFVYDNGPEAVALLVDTARLVTERANRLRGVTRKHVPTVAEPLVLLIIDEAAALTAYIDKKYKPQVEQALGIILTQGRAVGVAVKLCVQEPSKEVLGMRQLVPYRTGFRMSESTHTAMVFGPGARERGALCDKIPRTTPGVAFVEEDGNNDILRVRAYHVTDEDIARIVATYRPGAPRPGDGDSKDALFDGTEFEGL